MQHALHRYLRRGWTACPHFLECTQSFHIYSKLREGYALSKCFSFSVEDKAICPVVPDVHFYPLLDMWEIGHIYSLDMHVWNAAFGAVLKLAAFPTLSSEHITQSHSVCHRVWPVQEGMSFDWSVDPTLQSRFYRKSQGILLKPVILHSVILAWDMCQ